MLMRLLKLGVLALLGYTAYQFIQGLLHAESDIASDRREPMAQGGSGVGTFTGGGTGRTVKTEDTVGTSTPHRVGRGVIRH